MVLGILHANETADADADCCCSYAATAVVGAADADCCCSSLVHDWTDWLVHDVQLTAADWPVNDVPLTGWSMIDGLSYNGYTLHA